MNKKFVKILNIALVAMMLVCISTSVFALTPSELKPADNVTGSPEIQSAGNSIISILQTVGVVLSVVVLMIIGIKYMMGSAEEKEELQVITYNRLLLSTLWNDRKPYGKVLSIKYSLGEWGVSSCNENATKALILHLSDRKGTPSRHLPPPSPLRSRRNNLREVR